MKQTSMNSMFLKKLSKSSLNSILKETMERKSKKICLKSLKLVGTCVSDMKTQLIMSHSLFLNSLLKNERSFANNAIDSKIQKIMQKEEDLGKCLWNQDTDRSNQSPESFLHESLHQTIKSKIKLRFLLLTFIARNKTLI